MNSPLCLLLQYPPGYLAAMANKTKKESCARPGHGGRTKYYGRRGRPRRRKVKAKEEDDEEDEEEDEEIPEASIPEEGPQSNGEQKTTEDPGGCFYRMMFKSGQTRACKESTGENRRFSGASLIQ